VALLRADWAATFQVGHPGLTTRWTGALGILVTYLLRLQVASGQLLLDGHPSASLRAGSFQDFLADLGAHLPEVLAATRYPTVILTSMGVVGLYFLVRLLFGQRAALLSAVLLALEPLYLALSRVIHHDALSTTFMALSLLSFLVHLRVRERRPFFYLVLSGLMAGLAFLSKSPSLFLVPFTGLLSLRAYWARKRSLWPPDWRGVAELGRDWAIWGLVAALIFVLLWPAMWVDPLGTIQGVIGEASGYAASPHKRGNFFLGKAGLDPGPFFYPVAFLFRLTPLTLLGLGGSMLLLLGLSSKAYRDRWRSFSLQGHGEEDRAGDRWHVVQCCPGLEPVERLVEEMFSLWAFILLYVLFMTTGAKKFDRYLLPIFPMIDILAALGLLALGEVVWAWVCPEPCGGGRETLPNSRRGGGRFDRVPRFRAFVLGLALVLLLQAGFVLPHHPYYLTYYNPLLGGGLLAPRMLLVGWGEGLEQAARYLSVKGGEVRATSWYGKYCFEPFFLGQSFPLTKSGVFWNKLDYVVLYINQVQRQLPDPQFVQCFRSLELEHTVRIKGIDYVWIYKVPEPVPDCALPLQYAEQLQLGDSILFLGYEVVEKSGTFDGKLRINLYWRALREMGEDYTVYLKLVNEVYHVWGQQDSRPYWDGLPTNSWKKGQVIGDPREIAVLPGTPPGLYRIEVILYDMYSGRALEPLGGGKFLSGPVEIPRWESLDPDSLDIGYPLGVTLGDKVHLLGYNMESGFQPGDNIHLTIFWQCLEEMEQSYTVFTHLVDAGDSIVAQKDNPPVDGFHPTTKWEVGEIVRDQYDLVIPPETPPGWYRLEVGMYLSSTMERLQVAGDTSGRNAVILEMRVVE
jgi:hypothetical protein